MAKSSNDNPNTPTEPPPDEQSQGSNRDPDQETELAPLGTVSPNTTTNPRIKNL